MKIIDQIADMHADMTAWRRDIHAHPELGFEEHRTADIVATKLREFGLDVYTGIGKTGVVGALRVGNAPRSVGLRADMDALPIQEGNTFAHVDPEVVQAEVAEARRLFSLKGWPVIDVTRRAIEETAAEIFLLSTLR